MPKKVGANSPTNVSDDNGEWHLLPEIVCVMEVLKATIHQTLRIGVCADCGGRDNFILPRVEARTSRRFDNSNRNYAVVTGCYWQAATNSKWSKPKAGLGGLVGQHQGATAVRLEPAQLCMPSHLRILTRLSVLKVGRSARVDRQANLAPVGGSDSQLSLNRKCPHL